MLLFDVGKYLEMHLFNVCVKYALVPSINVIQNYKKSIKCII